MTEAELKETIDELLSNVRAIHGDTVGDVMVVGINLLTTVHGLSNSVADLVAKYEPEATDRAVKGLQARLSRSSVEASYLVSHSLARMVPDADAEAVMNIMSRILKLLENNVDAHS